MNVFSFNFYVRYFKRDIQSQYIYIYIYIKENHQNSTIKNRIPAWNKF